jgi:hypothetical protein
MRGCVCLRVPKGAADSGPGLCTDIVVQLLDFCEHNILVVAKDWNYLGFWMRPTVLASFGFIYSN